LIFSTVKPSAGSIRLAALNSAHIEHDFRLNALASFVDVKAAAAALKKGKGSVVLFSTVAVRKGFPFHASIAMAKGAVKGLTLSLAAELAPQARVNAIAPSLMRTPLASRLVTQEASASAIPASHALAGSAGRRTPPRLPNSCFRRMPPG
jgi:NAD(P)-dependent dehydrogenase (short-subunit alcohol dehydrogenase family)